MNKVEDGAPAPWQGRSRSYALPPFLGACLFPGSEALPGKNHCGDAVFIDTGQGIYALADATGRHPLASRDLLGRLQAELNAGAIDGEAASPLDDAIARSWSRQASPHHTTFSCLALKRHPGGVSLRIYSGGDSMILVFRPADGRIHFQTRPDMNFAGRSATPPEPDLLEIADPEVRILMATDGLWDLTPPFNGGPVPPALFSGPVAEFPQRVERLLLAGAAKTTRDDLAMLLVDPFAPLPPAAPPILLLCKD